LRDYNTSAAGGPYTVTEDGPPPGWELVGCDSSVIVASGQTASLTCTNRRIPVAPGPSGSSDTTGSVPEGPSVPVLPPTSGSIQVVKELQGGVPSGGDSFSFIITGPNGFSESISCTVLREVRHAAVRLTRCGRQPLYHYRGRSASWLANGGLHTKLLHGDPRPDSDGYLYQRRRRKHPGAERATRRHRSQRRARFTFRISGPNSFTTTVSCTVPAGGTACSGTVDAVPAGSPYAIGEDAPPAGWRTVGCLPGSVTVIPGQTATVTCTNEGVGSIQVRKELQGGTAPAEGSLHLPHQRSQQLYCYRLMHRACGRYGMQRYG